MNRSELKNLAAARSYPSVSILAPTHRAFPDSRQEPVRIRNLVAEASQKLKSQFQKSEAEPVIAGLEALASRIDFQHLEDGIALFVNRDTSALHYLPFPVKERVVITDSFATRDLMFSLNRSPRYWVLSLNERPTRLFHAIRDHLTEVDTHGFPMSLENPLGDDKTPAGNMVSKPGHRDERLKNFFRQVDTALSQAMGPDTIPIALTGVEANIGFYMQVSRRANLVIATINGNYDAAPPHALAALVWPVVEKQLVERQEEVFSELGEAVGAGRVASGIGEAWRAAIEGRGDLLVVEKDYTEPGRLDDTGLVLTPTRDANGPGTLEDAVDELIEAVFLRGGRVAFVSNDSLKIHNRLALVLRY